MRPLQFSLPNHSNGSTRHTGLPAAQEGKEGEGGAKEGEEGEDGEEVGYRCTKFASFIGAQGPSILA